MGILTVSDEAAIARGGAKEPLGAGLPQLGAIVVGISFGVKGLIVFNGQRVVPIAEAGALAITGAFFGEPFSFTIKVEAIGVAVLMVDAVPAAGEAEPGGVAAPVAARQQAA